MEGSFPFIGQRCAGRLRRILCLRERCSVGFGGGWQGDLLTAFLLLVGTAARKNWSDASWIGSVRQLKETVSSSPVVFLTALPSCRRRGRCGAGARAASRLCWAGCSVRGREGGEPAELIHRFPLWFSSSTSWWKTFVVSHLMDFRLILANPPLFF